ncbi:MULTISPECIES: hypothetical protein [unclassified Nocardiopsis]|uniref:hypothetical protein n=1 Tax=unclassified Nocardiopsis TaxID=2649073 RepID=UPI001358C02F|nr:MULTISPECIES: hypothetical protein [unclassified Nocardiopsis]
MFELFFAWAVFTAVLGKSAEAAIHAWKGTVPPSHLRRMARIREREAKAARADLKPSEGFRGWARTVWADSWNEATERHRERWPDKAAKKRERARARWAWWDHVEEEAGRRWEERRTARDGSVEEPEGERVVPDPEPAKEGAGARYMAWETPERYGRSMAWEDLTDKERRLWRLENDLNPESRIDDSGERGRLRGERDRIRLERKRRSTPEKAPKGGSGVPSDTPDTTPKTPGQVVDKGVRGPRTPGQGPVSGGGATIPATKTGTDTEGDDMAEVINLSGATKFTRALHKNYTASTELLEEVMAWLHSQNITSGELHDRFRAILRTTADTADLTEKALATCEDQLKVRDAIEAAGGVSLSKTALLKG